MRLVDKIGDRSRKERKFGKRYSSKQMMLEYLTWLAYIIGEIVRRF